jgi:hypothetical protein
MTVAFLSRSGDKGDAPGDSASAACVAPACPAPVPRRPQGVAAARGSRFWALAGDSSDEEDEPSSLISPGLSLRPTPATVSDFVSEALANPSASFVRVGRRKRPTFAPGGRGPRWLSLSLSGERRRQVPVSPPRCSGGSLAGVARTVVPASVPGPPPSLPRASSLVLARPAPASAAVLDPAPAEPQIQICFRPPVIPVSGRSRWMGPTCRGSGPFQMVGACRGSSPFWLLGRPDWPASGPEGAYLSGFGNRSERIPPL